MIKIGEYKIEATIFPDGTSQVWKLDENLVKHIEEVDSIEVFWKFDSESELFHICQLSQLIREINPTIWIVLNMPFMPYARQDKVVSNDLSFSLNTFLKIVRQFIDNVRVYDVHSNSLLKGYFPNYIEDLPTEIIKKNLSDGNIDLICYPDRGAKDRYSGTIDFNYCVLNKVRDQSTGNITGIEILKNKESIYGSNVLIVDDICDGGRTFIEASKLLYQNGAKCVDLFVSHGIFSKGLEVLKESGIQKIIWGAEGVRN